MRNARRALLPLALMLALVASSPAPAAAEGPDGSVTLADGRVLPPAPAEMMQPSIQGSMLLENPALPAELGTGGSIGSVSGPPGSEVTSLQGTGPGGALPNGLRKEVLGFLPYWMLDSTSLASMRYDRVSTIAYFSIGATGDGHLVKGTSTGWTGWTSAAMSGVISAAHARGVRVVPTITLMSWSGDYTQLTSLLTSPSRRALLISEIADVIGSRGADGVNIDFEPVSTSLRDAFVAFIRELKAGLTAAKVGSYVTVDTMAGAATWATGYDVQRLSASGAADALMVMAYDFSWSGSARAGGVAPIESPYIFDATDALADYLSLVDGKKLIWGIPYYGRTWATQSSALNSRTCSSDASICPDADPGSLTSKAYYYTGARSQSGTYGRKWDSVGGIPWYAWYDSPNKVWRQGYYDDAKSLKLKYKLVENNSLAGIGIWTLLMDAGRSELWSAIEDRFVKTATRLAGDDRFETAAAVSASMFGANASVAFIATGGDFPDALAAGPAAAKLGGPVLLATQTSLPSATAAELLRLKPKQIVVLGGSGVIGNGVVSRLSSYTTGSVRRIAGADRYRTAAAVSAEYFSPGVDYAFVATGIAYPDALAGVGYAASVGGPMLLTGRSSLPAATRSELTRLRPKQIIVLGGAGAIGDAVAGQLSAYASSGVTRIWGADRYETAVAISRTAFRTDGPRRTFVATGANFPDGLAGAAAAGWKNAPLLLVPTDSLPASVAAELRRLNAPTTYVLGKGGAVSQKVLNQIMKLWD